MNTQEIVAQLNEEIARLTKARDMIIGETRPPIVPLTARASLLEILGKGPARQLDLRKKMGITLSMLRDAIDCSPEVETYGRGWVKLRDRDNDSERRQREVEG